MIKELVDKKLKKFKQDLAFELKHKDYFIKLYLNVIVLLFLFAVVLYFLLNLQICASWEGYLTLKNGSFFAYECVGNLTPTSPLYNPDLALNISNLYIP
jgi:hypothetical protein